MLLPTTTTCQVLASPKALQPRERLTLEEKAYLTKLLERNLDAQIDFAGATISGLWPALLDFLSRASAKLSFSAVQQFERILKQTGSEFYLQLADMQRLPAGDQERTHALVKEEYM